MRPLVLLLLCCAPALANEEVLLHSFKVAREDPFSPQGKARMDRAIEALGKDGGAECAAALGEFLKAANVAEEKIRADRHVIERRGRNAFNGIEQVKREIEHLRAREAAGAKDVGPKIEARVARLEGMERAVENAKMETMRLVHMHDEIFAKREAAVVACAAILSRLKPEELAKAVGSLRKSLEVDDADQVLLLVRILRESERKETAVALLEVFSHPKSNAAGRTASACAIAFLAEPNATRLLVQRLQQDAAAEKPMDRKRILHELGLAARKRFEDFDAAAEWSETLK